MMFQWTETDVSNLVKFVLQSIRMSGQGASEAIRERMIAAIAAELGASSWHVYFGKLSCSNGEWAVTWLADAASTDQARKEVEPEDLNATYGDVLLRLQQLVQEYECAWDDISNRDRNTPHCTPLKAIVWSALRPDGSCVCMEFCKSASDGGFTARDEAILRVLSPELLEQMHPPEVEREVATTPELVQLPPRQREVLASLLSGSSVKEIACELGISPYTVNDYIKAIYRRYNVCSRGELLAVVHGHRKQTVS